MSSKKDSFSSQDKNYMKLAINLARSRKGLTGDNPSVGCLIVKNDTVIDMGYQCKSCVYCQASVSLLSQKIKNKNLYEIKKFLTSCEDIFEDTKIVLEKNWKVFFELFKKENLSRKECLLLPIRTVLKALKI